MLFATYKKDYGTHQDFYDSKMQSHIFKNTFLGKSYQNSVPYELFFSNLKFLIMIENIQAKSMVFLNIIFVSHLQNYFFPNVTSIITTIQHCCLASTLFPSFHRAWPTQSTFSISWALRPSHTVYLKPVSSCCPNVPLCSSYLHSHRTSTIHILVLLYCQNNLLGLSTHKHTEQRKKDNITCEKQYFSNMYNYLYISVV